MDYLNVISAFIDMAYVHLKVQKKEIGEEILRYVLNKYGKEITAFDLEEMTKEVYPTPDVILELRDTSIKGGSLSVTIPKEIKNFMNLQQGDTVLFVARGKVGRVYIEKVKRAVIREYG